MSECRTTITETDGWIFVRCGRIVVVVPGALGNGEDERAEIRVGEYRTWIEPMDDDTLDIAPVERFV